MHLALQQPHLGQLHLQRVERQRVGALPVHRFEPADGQRAAQAQRGLGRLLEVQPQVGVDHRRLQLDRQAGRPVTQVGLEVELGQAKGGVGLARIGKRQRLGARIKGAAVGDKGQLRLHFDLPLGRQVAEEGQRQAQVAHLVLAFHRAVVEVDAAAAQIDVVKRKTRLLGGFDRLGARGQLDQDVVDVVVAVAQVRQAQGRRLDLDGVHHGRQAEQRLQRGVGVDALDAELIGRARRAAHRHVVQRQLQRPRLEIHRADAHRAAELLAGDLLALPLEQRWHRQPAQRPQAQQPRHTIQRAPRPPIGRQPAAPGGGRNDRWRGSLGCGRGGSGWGIAVHL